MKSICRFSRTFEAKSMRISRSYSTGTITSATHNTESEKENNHWSFSPSYPCETFDVNSSDEINDDRFENFMTSKFKHDKKKEKLSLCQKSSKLNNLFDNVSINMLDNVLQKKIMSHAMNQDSKSSVNSWMLFNYERHENKKSWMLKNNNGYDANGIIIYGLNTIDNKLHKIGPIILNKQYV